MRNAVIGLYKRAKFSKVCQTRSQAVARIADRTASQHFWGSRDVICHVTIWYSTCHFLLVVLWNGVSISSRCRDIAL